MHSMTSANPFARAVVAFVVGGLAVLVVHQPVVALLHALGSTPITPYSLRATRPWGIPVFLSLSFWGGDLGDPDCLGIGSSAGRVDLLDRRNLSWRIAANLDDLVRHFSVEGSLGQQRRRVSGPCQCVDCQRRLGFRNRVCMVSAAGRCTGVTHCGHCSGQNSKLRPMLTRGSAITAFNATSARSLHRLGLCSRRCPPSSS